MKHCLLSAATISIRQDVCHSVQEMTAAPVLSITQAWQAESGLHRDMAVWHTLSLMEQNVAWS